MTWSRSSQRKTQVGKIEKAFKHGSAKLNWAGQGLSLLPTHCWTAQIRQTRGEEKRVSGFALRMYDAAMHLHALSKKDQVVKFGSAKVSIVADSVPRRDRTVSRRFLFQLRCKAPPLEFSEGLSSFVKDTSVVEQPDMQIL